MLAIPIKNLGENPVMSEYFGKSKWFAIIDGGIISFEKNRNRNGCKIVDWLYDLGVTQTFINLIGASPFEKLSKMDIECLCSDEKVKTLTEVLEKLEAKKLIKIDKKNFGKFVDFTQGCKEQC